MKKIKVDKVILYYMDRVDPDGNPYRFYVYMRYIFQIVYSIYVVELTHDSIQNNIHEASFPDTSFSWNGICCICMKSFFYL